MATPRLKRGLHGVIGHRARTIHLADGGARIECECGWTTTMLGSTGSLFAFAVHAEHELQARAEMIRKR